MLRVEVGLLASGNAPFSGPAQGPAAANHAGLEGFEVSLMDALCQRANLECTAVALPSLEDRVSGVANGTFNLTISSLSFTPGRQAVVHFVRPFYYSSGVALFSTDRPGLRLFGPGSKPGTTSDPLAGWRGAFTGTFPVGQTLCFVEGYYALPFVLEDLNINVDISPTLEQAVEKVRNGRCVALAYDSVNPESAIGLKRLNAPAAYVSPYGVAISKQAAGSDLEKRLVWALTGVMNQGNESEILKLEKQWLDPSGIGPESALQGVVDAISNFGIDVGAGPGKVPETYRLFGIGPGAGRRLKLR